MLKYLTSLQNMLISHVELKVYECPDSITITQLNQYGNCYLYNIQISF